MDAARRVSASARAKGHQVHQGDHVPLQAAESGRQDLRIQQRIRGGGTPCLIFSGCSSERRFAASTPPMPCRQSSPLLRIPWRKQGVPTLLRRYLPRGVSVRFLCPQPYLPAAPNPTIELAELRSPADPRPKPNTRRPDAPERKRIATLLPSQLQAAAESVLTPLGSGRAPERAKTPPLKPRHPQDPPKVVL